MAGITANQFPDGRSLDLASLMRVRMRESEKVARKLMAGSHKAADKLISLIDAESEGIALKASTEVLDRTIGKPGQTIALEVKHDAEAIELSDADLIARLEASGVPVPTRLRARHAEAMGQLVEAVAVQVSDLPNDDGSYE